MRRLNTVYIEIYEYFDTESEMIQNKWHYSLTRHDTTIVRRWRGRGELLHKKCNNIQHFWEGMKNGEKKIYTTRNKAKQSKS